MDILQGFAAIRQRQIREVNVHGKARQIPEKEIDRRSTFQGEDLLDENVRKDSQNKLSLSIEEGVLHSIDSLSCLGIVI